LLAEVLGVVGKGSPSSPGIKKEKKKNNNCPPASNFQKSERETVNQVSLALRFRRANTLLALNALKKAITHVSKIGIM